MLANTWGDKFDDKAMKDFARFATTYNLVSQTLAVHGSNRYDMIIAGGGDFVMNGIYYLAMAANTASLFATNQTAPTATTEAWDYLTAAETSFAVDDICYTGAITTINQKFYKCVKAHEADYSLEPADNTDLWQAYANADEYILANDYCATMMVTAKSDGTLQQWIACETATASGTAPTIKVPFFDPSLYVVVGFMWYDNDLGSNTVTFCQTDGSVAMQTDATFYQQLGPVFPHPDNLPKN